jgi:uncharacterized protein
MSSERGTIREAEVKLCVLCRRHPVVEAWRPFCSERCQLQDLGRWAEGSYRIDGPALPDPDPEDSSS